eukprot:899475-Rhodomonas_salina.2
MTAEASTPSSTACTRARSKQGQRSNGDKRKQRTEKTTAKIGVRDSRHKAVDPGGVWVVGFEARG